MVSDETYEICLPVLQDAALEEEDKIDRLEALLKKTTTLQGQALENAVLDAVWRFREGGGSATSPPPIRQTILRRPSPASWRGPGSGSGIVGVGGVGVGGPHTPLSGSPRLGVSPLAPPGFVPVSFSRSSKSAAASPFGSPRPSPRLAFATPVAATAIPHSPSLNAYEFASDPTPAAEIFGDAQQTDNVDWLVSDDAASVASESGGVGLFSTGAGVGAGAGGGGSGTATPSSTSGLNAAAPEFSLSSLSSQQLDMTPYDMLRSILGPSRTDDEIDAALAAHGYDLGATITAIMDSQQQQDGASSGGLAPHSAPSIASSADDATPGGVVIGKSMTPDARPSTPADQKSGILCKFFLSTGQCLRADCRFSHDLSNHICKYWVAGNCLAGSTCVFSHDPAHLMARLTVDGTSTPPTSTNNPDLLHDATAFPALHAPQPATPEHQLSLFPGSGAFPAVGVTPPPGFKPPLFGGLGAGGGGGMVMGLGGSGGGVGVGVGGDILRPRSRPGSRHQLRHETNSGYNSSSSSQAPPIDDTEAFPSLGSAKLAAAAGGKKHHGKRGGHGHKDGGGGGGPPPPSSLADIVKMSPSPGPDTLPSSSPGTRPAGMMRKLGRNGSQANLRNGYGGGGGSETSAAAQAIPTPKHIPWLETGDKANKAYLKARQEAIKHGGLRNKFLQSAAQAWNRNDARAAKALSLRGQSENDLMRKAHREAARELYEERNRGSGGRGGGGGGAHGGEIYVDLHGLHPEEAVEYLERVLLDNAGESRPVYAITGTGHHSKNGKDKVGKAVRAFLHEWRYAYREFSVPSDRNNMGGILGIDARSWDRSLVRRAPAAGAASTAAAATSASTTSTAPTASSSSSSSTARDLLAQGVEIGDGKVRLLVRDPSAKDAPKAQAAR